MVGYLLGSCPQKRRMTDSILADNSTTNCEADLHGPQISKYCADGGVYYLQSLTFSGLGKLARPNTNAPYGLESLADVGIEAWVSL